MTGKSYELPNDITTLRGMVTWAGEDAEWHTEVFEFLADARDTFREHVQAGDVAYLARVGSNAVRALQDKVGCKVYPVVGGVQARQMGSGTVFKHQQWLIAQGISCGSSGADGYQGRDTNVAIGQALVKQLYR